jgi:hypothetical protein
LCVPKSATNQKFPAGGASKYAPLAPQSRGMIHFYKMSASELPMCSVCREKFIDSLNSGLHIIVFPCGHSFCELCASKMSACPLDKSEKHSSVVNYLAEEMLRSCRDALISSKSPELEDSSDEEFELELSQAKDDNLKEPLRLYCESDEFTKVDEGGKPKVIATFHEDIDDDIWKLRCQQDYIEKCKTDAQTLIQNFAYIYVAFQKYASKYTKKLEKILLILGQRERDLGEFQKEIDECRDYGDFLKRAGKNSKSLSFAAENHSFELNKRFLKTVSDTKEAFLKIFTIPPFCCQNTRTEYVSHGSYRSNEGKFTVFARDTQNNSFNISPSHLDVQFSGRNVQSKFKVMSGSMHGSLQCCYALNVDEETQISVFYDGVPIPGCSFTILKSSMEKLSISKLDCSSARAGFRIQSILSEDLSSYWCPLEPLDSQKPQEIAIELLQYSKIEKIVLLAANDQKPKTIAIEISENQIVWKHVAFLQMEKKSTKQSFFICTPNAGSYVRLRILSAHHEGYSLSYIELWGNAIYDYKR